MTSKKVPVWAYKVSNLKLELQIITHNYHNLIINGHYIAQ